MALASFGLGRTAEAARLLEAAADPRRPFAVSRVRADDTRRRWAATTTTPGALPNARGKNWVTDDSDPTSLRATVRAYLVAHRSNDDAALHVFASRSVDEATAVVLDAVASVGLSTDEPFADICIHDLALTAEHAEKADVLLGPGLPERLAQATKRRWHHDVPEMFRTCSSSEQPPKSDTASPATRR
jgi:hypothetical protein